MADNIATSGSVQKPNFKAALRAQVKGNWTVFRVSWPWFLLALFLMTMHGWAIGLVSFLEYRYDLLGKQSNLLVDFGHMIIPAVEVYPAGGICTWLLVLNMVWTLFSLMVMTIMRPRPGITVVGILWRTVSVGSIAFTLRSISFLVTLLPAPWPECHDDISPNSRYDLPPPTVSDILVLMRSTSGCGDLIFSGHMTCCMLCVLVMTCYSTNWIINIPVWILLLGEIVALLAERAHYSVDIVIALYTTPMLWMCFYHFFPKDPSAHIAFWRDQPHRGGYMREESSMVQDSQTA